MYNIRLDTGTERNCELENRLKESFQSIGKDKIMTIF